MLKLFAIAVFLLAAVNALPLKWMSAMTRDYSMHEEGEWLAFKMKYAKVYKSGVEAMLRKETFAKNLQLIHSHNKLYENGRSTFKMGVNKFADMDSAEFNAVMNGLRRVDWTGRIRWQLDDLNAKLPSDVDWRTSGCVTRVKDQRDCGSCWAFSATGSLEGLYCLLRNRTRVSLSEQQLVDCSTKWGNKGCKGGNPSVAFMYIQENGGIDTEASYPYTARQGNCKFNKKYIAATDSGDYSVKQSESSLQAVVAHYGPVSVGIDASLKSFQLYHSGVYYDPKCSSQKLNHGVLAVGYGSQSGKDYWIVKNSWGPGWGQSGYILMSRNKLNQCGIATMATFPKVP